jgi:hypothetical protein
MRAIYRSCHTSKMMCHVPQLPESKNTKRKQFGYISHNRIPSFHTKTYDRTIEEHNDVLNMKDKGVGHITS